MEFSCNGYVYEDSTSFKITILLCAILNFFLSIPTFFIDLAVFTATLKCKHLPHVTKVFFANLALANSLTACFSQLTTAINFTLISLKKSPCFIAEFSGLLSFAVISVSFLTSVCLALERYISVIHPFVYSVKATRRKAVGTTVFLWFICYTCVLPSLVNKNSTVITMVAGFAIIFFDILCVVCYLKVYLVTRRIKRQISVEQRRFDTAPTRKTGSKLMLSTCFIILSFVCSYFPVQVVALFTLTNTHGTFSCFMYWTWTIAHTNALINPLITCWQLSTIRNGVLSLWKRQTHYNITMVRAKGIGTSATKNSPASPWQRFEHKTEAKTANIAVRAHLIYWLHYHDILTTFLTRYLNII